MKYKLIVVDMDGTLLNSNNEVSTQNQNALKKAQENGIIVAIATGRIFSSARAYCRMLGLKAPIIACNGALIKYENTEEVLYSGNMEKEDAIKVVEIFKKHDVYFHFYDKETMYIDAKRFDFNIYKEWNEAQSEENKVEVVKVEDPVNYILNNDVQILKLMAVEDDNEKVNKIRKDLENIENIIIEKSWHNNIEVMLSGTSKGKGIERLSEIYNIRAEEIIAFGDNYNDLSMKDYVGTFVAMANGEDYVKSQAHYVTASNDEHGVAKGIEDLIFNR